MCSKNKISGRFSTQSVSVWLPSCLQYALVLTVCTEILFHWKLEEWNDFEWFDNFLPVNYRKDL